MMRYWRITLMALVAILVQGCGPQFQTFYEYTPPRTAEGRLCTSQCQTIQSYCRNNCSAEVKMCKQQDRYQSQQKYDRYAGQHKESNRKVERRPSSFESYSSCGDSRCTATCESDFRMCYSTCGGQVKATTTCTSGCDQLPQAGLPASSSPMPRTAPEHPAYSGASPLCRPGAQVEVLSEGEWYPAKVKAAPYSNGRCPIHYIGYGSEEDEAVPANAMRRPNN